MLVLGEESLMAIAQIAIALIGFSGVVVTLGRTDGSRWTESEMLQLRTLIEPSMVVLAGAFIPLGVTLADIRSELVWQISNALLFILNGIAHTMFLIRGTKSNNVIVRSQKIIGTIGVFIYLSMIASALNLIASHQLTYLVALSYGLCVSLHNFYLLLFRPDSVAGSDKS